MCQQPILTGSCDSTQPRWAFDQKLNMCKPFYFSGCGGNLNNFPSLAECRLTCPDTAPPSIRVAQARITAEIGQTVTMSVNIRSARGFKVMYKQSFDICYQWEAISRCVLAKGRRRSNF